MKKIAIAFIALSFLFASCGKKTEESTHTHDDGSTHADHATDTVQEEFNAADTTEHTHDGQSHEHQDSQ